MMMNPTINRIEQLDNFQDSIQSTQAIDRLRAMQGLRDLPTVQMEEGGSIADTAQDLASYGRFGDSVLIHVRPDELQGLMSLGNITYNPITGLPEAWGLKSIIKPFKNIAKSKAFKTIAPIAIGLAAPGLLGPKGLGLFKSYAGLGGAAKYGLASFIGGGLGALASGKTGSDIFKQAAISGVTGGALKGISNYAQQRALAKGLETAAAEGATSGSAALEAGTSNVQGSVVAPSDQLIKGGSFDAAGNKITTAYKPSTEMITGAPENFGTYADIPRLSPTPSVAVEPNYMAQAADILASDPTASATFNIGEKGITEAAAKKTAQEAAARPFQEALIEGALSFDKTGGIDYLGTAGKLAAKAAPMELGSTYLDYEDAEEAAEEEARRQLEEMNYEIDTGFGGQTVIRDPEGVVLPAYLSSQDILNIALGKIPRPRLVAGTQFAPTSQVMAAEEGTKKGGIGDLPPRVEKTVTQMENNMINDIFEMEDEEFEEKYNTSKDEAYQFIKDQTGMTDGDFNELFSGRALQLIKKEQGGLINLAAGGEFSGMVPGRGGGMDDNVFMPIKEGNKQVGTLAVSPTEYVVDSYTMAALGDGNPSEGAKVMDGVVKRVRQKAYGTMKQPNEIDGLQALGPMVKGV
tara:strand:+ start:794 stop:2695 length:1902 start_codon:yes stop_codon:yes gene_type:complete